MNMKRPTSSGSNSCALQTVEFEISYLEWLLCPEIADTVFGQTYWRGRVMLLNATPGLAHEQRLRIQRLLNLLEEATR
jgi:hypothetical protein